MNRKLILPVLLLLFLISWGCALPGAVPVSRGTTRPVNATLTPEQTPEPAEFGLTQAASSLTQTEAALPAFVTFTAQVGEPAAQIITDTPAPSSGQNQEPCGYQWAYEPLPDVSSKLQAAYAAAGFTDIKASAQAFGENCTTASGKVQSFSAMETDFRLEVPVERFGDETLLGDRLAALLPVLIAFPKDQLSGPNPGRVEVHFIAPDSDAWKNFELRKAADAILEGLNGAALYQALSN